MELYKTLIVDDEEEVRQGIIDCMPWQDCGFEIAGHTDNGADALELAEALRPDLVITDIKMPYMDGLTLTARLAEVLPTTKVVIITGFDDFQYAKRAIGLNVMDYILKPIHLQELTEILHKIKKTMDEEKNMLRDFVFLKEHYEKSLPILRDNFLLSLLEGRAIHDVKAQHYGLALDNNYFAVICLRVDYGEATEQGALIQFSIKRFIDEYLPKHLTTHTLIYAENIVTVASFRDRKEINALISTFHLLCKDVEKYYGLLATAGVGYVVELLSELHKSYRGAISALDYRVMMESGRAIFIDDIEPDSHAYLELSERYELLLMSAIRKSDTDVIEETVHILLDRCDDLQLPYQTYQFYLMEIINVLIKLVRSFGMEINEIMGEQFHPMECLSGLESKSELYNWLAALCLKVSAHIRRERQDTSGRLVDQAKAYGLTHFKNPKLSIEGMCGELHISPAYFSTLFKKETGVTFVQYITDLRLSEAKRLLLETDLKTYLIAEKTGFEDPNYFSFVFKKHFGISPTKFRSGPSSA